MIKTIPSGLKTDESWEEGKSLEHRPEEMNFTGVLKYCNTPLIWMLLLKHNMNALPYQRVMFGVHHSLILSLPNYTKFRKISSLPHGQFFISVSATVNISTDT